ncbi:MAG: hypothetical protein FJX75_21880 [Armatimonadetes bacterium]|nr:hypothetical protein [Armatimonadota bacterium]
MAAQVFDFASIRPKVEQALREQFPHDTVELTEGYKGRVHVLVVSSQFNGKTESEKQDFLWEVLRAELGEDAQAVTLVIGYGTDELK